LDYVKVDGLECLAKTDEEQANVFCNYFSSEYVVEYSAPFDTLQTNENLSSMPNISFDCVDIVTRLKHTKCKKNQKDQMASIQEFYLKIHKS